MTQPRCRSPLANVPKPIPHQTVESLAALLALENVSFMSPESHQPRQQTIGARARSCLLDTVSNALGDSTVQTAKRFGHESILTMCLSTSQFEQVTRGLPLNDSLRSVLLISSAIRFCPRCMADDFRERGFAAARVSHQYLGVRACHLHGIALVLLPQGRVDFNEQAGLLLDERLLERPDFRTPLPKPALFDLKFSKFVHAAVTGTLHSLHGKEWLPRVAQAASRWSISNSLTLQLCGATRMQVPAAVLQDLQLELAPDVEASWPNMLARSSTLQRNPLPHLVLIAALFRDVDEFNLVMKGCEERLGRAKDAPKVGSSFGFSSTQVVAIAKSIALGACNRTIEERFNVGPQRLKVLARQHPALFEEARSKRKRINESASEKSARDSLRIFIECFPNGSRTLFQKADPGAHTWWRKHDSASMMRALPEQPGGTRNAGSNADDARRWLSIRSPSQTSQDVSILSRYREFCSAMAGTPLMAEPEVPRAANRVELRRSRAA